MAVAVMTPEAAIYSWLSSFGMPAYATSSVPDQDSPLWNGFPYISYTLVVSDWGEPEVNMTVNIFDRTESEAKINAEVRRISDELGHGGSYVKCDGGAVWLKKGQPWAQDVSNDELDSGIKRRYVNINIEYMTT